MRVIIGNPPYKGKSKDGNEKVTLNRYPLLDRRIKDTFGEGADTTNTNVLSDSYIKAFRWALDRIERTSGDGVIAFISNSGWIDKPTFMGVRKTFEKEVSNVYIIDLKAIKVKL